MLRTDPAAFPRMFKRTLISERPVSYPEQHTTTYYVSAVKHVMGMKAALAVSRAKSIARHRAEPMSLYNPENWSEGAAGASLQKMYCYISQACPGGEYGSIIRAAQDLVLL